MGLRERGESRRGPGGTPGPVVFRMRSRLMDLADDFWVKADDGRTVYQVDGTAVRLRESFTIRDAGGEVVARMRERVARVGDTMEIDRPGRPVATVTKAMLTPVRERYVVEADDVGTIEVHGDVVDHEYTFERDGETVAEVSKRWMTVRDTYGVQVDPGADPVLVLAATAAIDALSG